MSGKFYDIEHKIIVTMENLEETWNSLSPEEQEEWGGKFGHYVSSCMFYPNGGTLIPIYKRRHCGLYDVVSCSELCY